MIQHHRTEGVFLRTMIRLAAAAILALPLFATGQTESELGIIAGTVTESGIGKPIGEVAITVRGLTLATTTDAGGRYSLRLVPPGDHVVIFSRAGFTRAVVENVRVAPGLTTRADYALKPQYYEMDPFEVIAPPYEEQTVALLEERKDSAVMMDAIGSEFLSKVGASDAGEAVSKVAGAAVVDGKYAVIRGLNDRYSGSLLNNAEIPSSDPYRKGAQLDMFPTAMIESIQVSKTFTPDQPGGITGGAINIITKSFPEKFSAAVSFGVEYNTQSTFNDDYLASDGGSTDFLGMDDGTRALPDLVANTDPLPPSSIRDQATADLEVELLNSFGSQQMGPVREAPPLNHSFSANIGDTVSLFGSRLGLFTAFSYQRKWSFYENGQQGRVAPSVAGDFQPEVVRDLEDSRSLAEVNWSGLVGVAYEPFKDQTIGFNFLYNQASEDIARKQSGAGNLEQANGSEPFTTYLNEVRWVQRNLINYQLRGDHLLPLGLDFKLNWLASIAESSQDEPDLKYFNFKAASDNRAVFGGSQGVPEPGEPTRFYRELDDDSQTYRVDLTAPFQQWTDTDSSVKVGLFLNQGRRNYEEYLIQYRTFTQETVDPETYPNTFLNPEFLDYTRRGSRYIFDRILAQTINTQPYRGEQTIQAAYAMTDLALWESCRLIGGARFETTDLRVESSPFSGGPAYSSVSELKTSDVLPALGLVYTVATNMNLRLHYGRTIARPTYREIADYRAYDVTGDEILQGNTNLTRSVIDNFDARWEWFPNPGDVLSASVFYKSITDPIEKKASDRIGLVVTYDNFPSADVYGAEFEARKNLRFISDLLDSFSFGLNLALIQSAVGLRPNETAAKEGAIGETVTERPLYDQSPYIVNVDFSYENVRSRTRVTVVFSQAGERLYFFNENGFDVYEQPAPELNVIISQRIGRGWRLGLSAKNVLNPKLERTYDAPGEPVYSSFTKGITFGLNLGYEF